MNTRREVRHGYMCFIDNYTIAKTRVVNIEEVFHNLSHRIYILMQYMNESVGSNDWSKLNEWIKINSFNYIVLFTYQVTNFPHLATFYIHFFFISLHTKRSLIFIVLSHS